VIRAADISTEMLAFVPSGTTYRTADEVLVDLSHVPQVQHNILLPAGYHFDGASIPRCCWALIGSPFEPDLMLAACVHDWYCEHTADCYQSRVIGDAVFFYLLAAAGVARWRRVLMYLGVRLNSYWCYGRLAK
jgi:hypothetical protein